QCPSKPIDLMIGRYPLSPIYDPAFGLLFRTPLRTGFVRRLCPSVHQCVASTHWRTTPSLSHKETKTGVVSAI
ncbi:MAG: hypothetical protein ABI600_20350, partial [Luteolibacter sp.]